MRRLSPATVISLVALVVAMSGTAVAATGGDFVLGKANTATRVSSLTNKKGTALSLGSSRTAPPLKVSNSVQVPKLDASYLGGISAKGFVHGNGTVAFGRVAKAHGFSDNFLLAGNGGVIGYCDVGGTGASMSLVDEDAPSAQAVWWNQNGTSDAAFTAVGQAAQVSPLSEGPYVVLAQMNTGTDLETYTLTATYDPGTDTCSFTGQAVVTKG